MAQPRDLPRGGSGCQKNVASDWHNVWALSFGRKNKRTSWAPKIPFPFPTLSVLTLVGWYLLLLREGQELLGLWTIAGWDVVAQNCCSLENTELGQEGTPSIPQSQMLGAVACLALLHRALGTLLGQNIPRIVLRFRFGGCLGGDILKCPLSLAMPTWNVPRSLHCAWSFFQESCFGRPSASEAGDLSSLGAGGWCNHRALARRTAEDEISLGGTSGAMQGHEIIFLLVMEQLLHITFLQGSGSQLSSGVCSQGFSLVLPSTALPGWFGTAHHQQPNVGCCTPSSPSRRFCPRSGWASNPGKASPNFPVHMGSAPVLVSYSSSFLLYVASVGWFALIASRQPNLLSGL